MTASEIAQRFVDDVDPSCEVVVDVGGRQYRVTEVATSETWSIVLLGTDPNPREAT